MPHYWRRAWSWSAYVASHGLQAFMMTQITYYMTESLMMSVGIGSAIIAFSRVFDGFTDLIAGIIVDRTKTRWGNARPWSLITILMWGALVLLFSTPDLPYIGKIIYIFIMYNLSDSVGRTMLFASESVHMKKGFTDDEQLSVTGMSGLFGGVLAMICAILMPALIANYGQTPHGWTFIALLFAVPGIGMGVLKFFFLPEMDYAGMIKQKKKEKQPLKQSVKVLFHNKYIFIFMIALILLRFMQGMGISNFYFTYVVGDLSLLSYVAMFGMLSMLTMPFIPMFSRKLGIRKFIFVFQLIGGIAVALQFLNPTSIAMLSFGSIAVSVFGLPLSMLMNIVAIQCMKYSEWKDNIRIDGLISSMNGVAMKVGSALGILFSGLLLGASGYVGGVANQPESVITMLKFLQIGVPAICMITGAIVMRFYTLEKKMPEIEAGLKERYNKIEMQQGKM